MQWCLSICSSQSSNTSWICVRWQAPYQALEYKHRRDTALAWTSTNSGRQLLEGVVGYRQSFLSAVLGKRGWLQFGFEISDVLSLKNCGDAHTTGRVQSWWTRSPSCKAVIHIRAVLQKITALYAWNLCNFMGQCHTYKFNNKKIRHGGGRQEKIKISRTLIFLKIKQNPQTASCTSKVIQRVNVLHGIILRMFLL